MEKLIVLKLDTEIEADVRVTLTIGKHGESPTTEVLGWLPPVDSVVKDYGRWLKNYYSLSRLRSIEALEASIDGSLTARKDCQVSAQLFRQTLNSWLRSPKFQPIREAWLMEIGRDEAARVLLRTNSHQLRRLPWHLWDLLEQNYKQVEVALGALEYRRADQQARTSNSDNVRVLAILGNSEGIDVHRDLAILTSIHNADVIFLSEPQRSSLSEQLWEQSWDILFFAGHSQTEGGKGRIFLNPEDSLTLDELRFSLQRAVHNGLQLAIFNSCDGLGLAKELEPLNIPQMIIMREPVPDLVAQEFLKYFLQALAKGDSCYLAVREARERLQGIEKDFPGSSWLPVICQNAALPSPTWPKLSGTPLPPVSTESLSRNTHDWGDAPDVSGFIGRTEELTTLEKWIAEERCRLVSIVGLAGVGKTRLSVRLGKGGIGKTDLSLKLARGIQDEFDYVIWRRLLNAPSLPEILTDIVKFLSDQQEISLPEQIEGQIQRLLHYLQEQRCLLIFDNFETVLQGGQKTGQYRQGYEGYGQLLKQVGESSHQSCLLLTSREKPREVTSLQGRNKLVRCLELTGLSCRDGQQIFSEIGEFSGSESEWDQLIDLYDGNPLALELAARHIDEVFFGDIREFLQEGTPIFEDLQDLLGWHFERLSVLEKEVMYWFSINREPMSIRDLKNDILSTQAQKQIPSTLQSLQRRLPLERVAELRTIQPVLIEYMTDRLTEATWKEIVADEITLIGNHALIKATAKDYVRDMQIRLILAPVIENLVDNLGDKKYLKSKLKNILITLQNESSTKLGYAAGNCLNLLRQMRIDLSYYDFSDLTIRQAFLQDYKLHYVNFSNAQLRQSLLSQTLDIVYSVALNSDASLLVTGDGDGNVCLWNMGLNRQPKFIGKHRIWVGSVAINPSESLLASGSGDHTIKLWDVTSGECLTTLFGHEGWVKSVVFSPDGQTLASGSEDCKIKLWDLISNQCLQTLHGHEGWVISVAYSSGGQILASGSIDQTIKLWNPISGENIQTWQAGPGQIFAIAFNRSDEILASGDDHCMVKLWDVTTGECKSTLREHTGAIKSVAFSPTGNMLASSGDDNLIKLWNIETGKCLKTLDGHASRIWSVSFSADGKTLASGSDDCIVKIWDVNTGYCVTTLKGFTHWIWSVVFSPDGKSIVSAGADRKVSIWDIQTRTCQTTLLGHYGCVTSAIFSPGRPLLASSSEDGTVRIWHPISEQCLEIFRGHSSWVRCIAFSPDGQLLASGSEDGTIRLWDVDSGRCLNTFQGHMSWVTSTAFTPDGKTLISSSFDGTIRYWNVMTGDCQNVLTGHQSWVEAIALSPDGNLIASGSADWTIRIWDLLTGKCLRTLSEHSGRIWSIAFSPNQPIMVSGSDDCSIKVWNYTTGECLRTLNGHGKAVHSVMFSPDGENLASGSHDETILLWETDTWECLSSLRSPRLYEGMNIARIRGLTEAQKIMLKALGAVESDG